MYPVIVNFLLAYEFTVIVGDIFRVSVIPTDAAERVHVQGFYDLLVGPRNVTLVDRTTGQQLFIWPYTYIRRSGGNNTTFVFEAGRKCESGEGVFKFNLSNAKVRFQ